MIILQEALLSVFFFFQVKLRFQYSFELCNSFTDDDAVGGDCMSSVSKQKQMVLDEKKIISITLNFFAAKRKKKSR